MTWILMVFFVVGTQSASANSLTEYPTRAACEARRAQLDLDGVRAIVGHPAHHFEARCLGFRKPAPPMDS